MSDIMTANAEEQLPQNQTAPISQDKIADESLAATAAEVIQKNTPPSSPYESAMCSLQSSPAKANKTAESTAGDVPDESSIKTDEPDNKANVESTSGEGTNERKETSVTKVRASDDQQADTNVPPTDEGGLNTPSENVDSATDDTVIADAAAKVEISDDQKKQTKKDKGVAENNKGSSEVNKKATTNKDNNSKKKDRSPLRSRANRRHNNSGTVNNNYNRGHNQQNSHYGSRGDYRSDYRGGSYNYNNSRYNGYPSGGYRQNNHYPRVTVQNNYGLRSPPYKSNFEPSDSARKKADEFVRASVGTM